MINALQPAGKVKRNRGSFSSLCGLSFFFFFLQSLSKLKPNQLFFYTPDTPTLFLFFFLAKRVFCLFGIVTSACHSRVSKPVKRSFPLAYRCLLLSPSHQWLILLKSSPSQRRGCQTKLHVARRCPPSANWKQTFKKGIESKQKLCCSFFKKQKRQYTTLKSRNLGRNLFSNVAACCTLKSVSLLSSPGWAGDIKLL